MLIIGLLLVLLAAAVIAYMVVATAGMPDVRLDYGILNLEMPPLWLYLAGLLTLAVAALGFWMLGAGARIKARRAREVRELRKQAKEADRRAVRADDARTAGERPSTGPLGTRPTTASGSTPSSTSAPHTSTPRTSTPSSTPPGSTPPGPTTTSTNPATERNRLEPDH